MIFSRAGCGGRARSVRHVRVDAVEAGELAEEGAVVLRERPVVLQLRQLLGQRLVQLNGVLLVTVVVLEWWQWRYL